MARTDLDTFVVSNHPDAKRVNDVVMRVMNSQGKEKVGLVSFPVDVKGDAIIGGTLYLTPKHAGFGLQIRNSAAFSGATTYRSRPRLSTEVGRLDSTRAGVRHAIPVGGMLVQDGQVNLSISTTSPYELEIVSAEGAAHANRADQVPTLAVTGTAAGPPPPTSPSPSTTTPPNAASPTIAPPTTAPPTTAPPTTGPPTTAPSAPNAQPSETLMGLDFPSAGWPAIEAFERETGPLQMIHAYPAGRVLEDGLRQVDQIIERHPGMPVMWATFMAGRSFTDAQVAEFAQAIRARADKLPILWLSVDAEPDRKDRPYTATQFIDGFRRLRAAVGDHPNIVWTMTLTGYQFSQRIGAYAAIESLYDVLAVDPFWKAGQAGEGDLIAAAGWATAHGKQLAWAEWGVQQGPDQANGVARAFARMRIDKPIFAAYFHEYGSGPPLSTTLQGAALDAYKREAS